MNVIATDRSKFFALLHVPSGQFMRQTKHNRGYTDQNFPFFPWQKDHYGPRIFSTLQGAKQARACWLRGVWLKTNEFDLEEAVYGAESFDIKPRFGRKAADLVVVSVVLAVEGVIE